MKAFVLAVALRALLLPVGETDGADESLSDRIDSTVFTASRAGKNTPVTFSTISSRILGKASPSSSLPQALDLQPSVISLSEGGTGLGYTRMTVRGSKGSQINVTLNGVTLNDAESQEVFWVNIPAISSIVSSVQLQRGLGTSACGAGAFGASVNMSTAGVAPAPHARAEFGAGSWLTFTTLASAGSGLLPCGFWCDFAYSWNTTDGYIYGAKARVQSAYAALGWLRGDNSLRLTWLMGRQRSGITWEGISLEQYAADRRSNPAGEYTDSEGRIQRYPDQVDDYTQHHIQLNYSHQFSSAPGDLFWSTTLNYTRGDGYYEQLDHLTAAFVPVAARRAMGNNYMVLNSDIRWSDAAWKVTGGVSVSAYDGIQWGAFPTGGYEFYRNKSLKWDCSVYARAEWSPLSWLTAYADLQGRFIRHSITGSAENIPDPVQYLSRPAFFNPRAGLTFTPGPHKAYVSAALGHREPGRSDILDVIVKARESLLPEKMADVEIGYGYSSERLSASANLYFMEYWDMLLETGRINEVGYQVKDNVSRAYRRGVELSLSWKPLRWLDVAANTTLSLNRVLDWTGWTDVYDNPDDWNWLRQESSFHARTEMLMSPPVIAMLRLGFNPWRTLELSLDGKYVARQYLDSTGSPDRRVPGYYVCNASAAYTFDLRRCGSLRLGFWLNNFTDSLFYADGWCWRASFADGSAPSGGVGIYPQPPINWSFKLSWQFSRGND